MSEAYKCDSCGKFDEPPMGGTFLLIVDSKGRWNAASRSDARSVEGVNDEGERELCPDCAGQVMDLLYSTDDSGAEPGDEA